MIDPYAPCPCGSGKKLKWCCQTIMPLVEQAEKQFDSGQTEAALTAMERLTRQHSDNCVIWGRYAQLLTQAGRPAEAMAAVSTALEKNPNFTIGHIIKGSLLEESDLDAAIAHYRQGLELAAPGAFSNLGSLAAHAARLELICNRPLAAMALLAWGEKVDPTSEAITKVRRMMHEVERCLPAVVFADMPLLPLEATASPELQQQWEQTLVRYRSGRLSDAETAFQEFAAQHPEVAAAWYNLGLVRAWRGENAAAVEALHHYVELEPDEQKAGAAWTVAELLKQGEGMERVCDYLELQASCEINNEKHVVERLLTNPCVRILKSNEYCCAGVLLDRPLPADGVEPFVSDLPRVLAHFIIVQSKLILLHGDEVALAKGCGIIEQLLDGGIGPWRHDESIPDFEQLTKYLVSVYLPRNTPNDVLVRALERLFRQRIEEHWLMQPRKSLGLNTPVDAAGHPVLRKKLIGVINFFEQVMEPFAAIYNFDRLRRKLGLLTTGPEPAAAEREIADLSAAELAALDLEQMSDDDMWQAFQAAKRLDAGELAGRFAEALTARPPAGDDRYPLYQHLIHQAVAEELWGKALALADDGLRYDCEHQAGRRRNEYELRRAQIHLHSGDAETARDLFTRLVERTPSDLDILGRAAEAMLSAKLAAPAREFAQRGLSLAEKAGDRDRAGYFADLCHAATRQGAPA